MKLKTSKVYWLNGPADLELREEPLARPTANQLVASTRFTVISPGTELAAWCGKPPLRPSRADPRLLGYCNLAEVTDTGDAVRDVVPGDLIITHQSHRSSFSVEPAKVLVVRRGASPEQQRLLATTYLYHLGYVALLAGSYLPGTTVGIVGFGALGFATASLVASFGGQPVAFSGRPAADAGSTPGVTVLPKAHSIELPSVVRDLGGFDLVVNTSDSWSDYQLCLRLARKGGTIILLGFPGRGQEAPEFNPLDSQYLYDKQLTVRQAGHVTEADCPAIDARFTLKRNMDYLVNLIEHGVLNPMQLIAFEVTWKDLGSAYEKLATRAGPGYTALVNWT